jgi:hypothetical protein
MPRHKKIRQEYESEIKTIEYILKKMRSISEKRIDEIIQLANAVDADSLMEPPERFRVSREDLFHVQIFYHDLKERNQQ